MSAHFYQDLSAHFYQDLSFSTQNSSQQPPFSKLRIQCWMLLRLSESKNQREIDQMGLEIYRILSRLLLILCKMITQVSGGLLALLWVKTGHLQACSYEIFHFFLEDCSQVLKNLTRSIPGAHIKNKLEWIYFLPVKINSKLKDLFSEQAFINIIFQEECPD